MLLENGKIWSIVFSGYLQSFDLSNGIRIHFLPLSIGDRSILMPGACLKWNGITNNCCLCHGNIGLLTEQFPLIVDHTSRLIEVDRLFFFLVTIYKLSSCLMWLGDLGKVCSFPYQKRCTNLFPSFLINVKHISMSFKHILSLFKKNLPLHILFVSRVTQVGQHFTFVLTDIESKQRFGFCRLSSGGKVCLCILRWVSIY